MNETQKEEIKRLRQNGLGYKRIATALSLSVNTVKSYCQREKLDKACFIEENRCRLCGHVLKQTRGKKEKKYCSDSCRWAWWNRHLDKVNKKAYSMHTCMTCQTSFQSYGNRYRKYCSHSCYIKARFGGESDE